MLFPKVAFLSQQDRSAYTCRQKCLKLPIFSLRTSIFTWDALPVERVNDITLVSSMDNLSASFKGLFCPLQGEEN